MSQELKVISIRRWYAIPVSYVLAALSAINLIDEDKVIKILATRCYKHSLVPINDSK